MSGAVSFTKKQGALSRTLPGEDHISGLLMYGTAPAGYAVNGVPVRQFFSVKQAEQAGIVKTGTTPADADIKVLHYQISEFFRINPGAGLWVGIFTAADPNEYAEIITMQNVAGGKIRQIGVVLEVDVDSVIIGKLHARAVELYQEYKPLVVLAGFKAPAVLSTLPDMREGTFYHVGAVIGRDGNGRGNSLSSSLARHISAVGSALGALSKAAVHENIGWPERFNVGGDELDKPFIGSYSVSEMVEAQINDLTNKGYIFARKHNGIGGTYWNDSPTCVAADTDYPYLENTRTIDKGVRLVRAALLPKSKAPAYADPATGQLAPGTISYFETVAERALRGMETAGEISGFDVYIDPKQDINQSNGLIQVEIAIVPVGVARAISVVIGFTLKLQS